MKVKFQFGKETKGAIQFKEVPEGALGVERIGSLYVKKTALKELGVDGPNVVLANIELVVEVTAS